MQVIRSLFAVICALSPAWVLPAGGIPCPPRPAQCEISVTTYNFGRHEMTATTPPIRTQGSISVTCTKMIDPAFQVLVSYELQGLPPERDRRMLGRSTDELTYALFLDPALTRVWGDGTGGTSPIEDSISLRGNDRVITRNYLLFGRVDGGQQVEPGPYSGIVQARLHYTPTCDPGLGTRRR